MPDKLTIDNLFTEINTKHKLRSIYYLFGDEKALINKAINDISASFFGLNEKRFNTIRINASSNELTELLKHTRTQSMFSDKKLILFQDVHKLTPTNQKSLKNILNYEADDICLILISEGAKSKPAIIKSLPKQAVSVDFKKIYENQIYKYIFSEIKSKNKLIARDAANLLIQLIGSDLKTIFDSLEKLAIYSGNRQQISVKDVESLISFSKSTSIFELNDALGQRNLSKVLMLLNQLLDSGADPIREILPMLTRHIRQLLIAVNLSSKGFNNKEILQKLGIHPYFEQKFFQQVKENPLKSLIIFHDIIQRTDILIKSGLIEQRQVMNKMVLDMLGQFQT